MKLSARDKRKIPGLSLVSSSLSLVLLISLPLTASGQTHQHEHQSDHPDHHGHETAAMTATVIGGPFRTMLALGSGTALQPASTPMWAWHAMLGEWAMMVHAEIKTGFNYQTKPRGVGKAESANWFMTMAERDIGPGRLMLRGMFSAEPLTAPHRGFPQLFQIGETYRNRPIVDAQHPHDLLMELAASYTVPLSDQISIQVYGGPVAEPALGPVAFMHRASAAENPAPPLGHHLQDSTHISHGVVTGALTISRFKLEASRFRGREPDEDRVGIDLGGFDSYSFRAWFTPTPNWAAQFSYGRLKNPEAVHAGDLIRKTVSITYYRPLPQNGNWSSTLVWGRNDESHGDENSYLFESALQFKDKNHFYTRLELVDKKGLLISNIFGRPGLPTEPLLQSISIADAIALSRPLGKLLRNPGIMTAEVHPDPNFIDFEIYNKALRVGAFTFGGVRDLVSPAQFRIGLGTDVTFYHLPSIPRFPLLFDQIYSQRPLSFHFFVRFRLGNSK